MKYIFILAAIVWIWVVYEFWRAPLMEETEDGGLITKVPAKKLSDLWKKRQ